MSFKLNIKTDNAAFEDGYSEVVCILREIADDVEHGETAGQIRDVNGHVVGKYEYKR